MFSLVTKASVLKLGPGFGWETPAVVGKVVLAGFPEPFESVEPAM